LHRQHRIRDGGRCHGLLKFRITADTQIPRGCDPGS
jgi:hypothetical protein